MRTRGETLFGQYLSSRGIDFRYEPPMVGSAGPPDFAIRWGGVDCYLDVKDRENVNDDVIFPDPLQTPDSGNDLLPEVQPSSSWVRGKIKKGRAKFAGLQGNPCGVVVFAATGMTHDLEEADFMLGSMYGDVAMALEGEHWTPRFMSNGKMLDPRTGQRRNTLISAVITLRVVPIGDARRRRWRTAQLDAPMPLPPQEFDPTEQRLGVIVWDNVFAATPFPSDLFTGEFDERWGVVGETIRRVFVGAGLREYYGEPGHPAPVTFGPSVSP